MATNAYRQMLEEAQGASSQSYDKAIMTLSGGALGISLAFIHDVAPRPHEQWLLQTSWSFLSFSLLLIVGSFLASEHAFWKAIAAHDARIEHPSRWVKTVFILNIASGASFIGGVAFLVCFAVYDLSA